MSAGRSTAGADVHGPAPVPWGGWWVVGYAVVVFFAAIFLTQLLASAWASLTGTQGEVPLAVLVIASPVALLLVTCTSLVAMYGDRWKHVAGPRPWQLSDVGVGATVGLAAFLALRLLTWLVVVVITQSGAEVPAVQDTFRVIAENPSTVPALAVAAVLLAPVAEELLFRGVIFQGLRAKAGLGVSAVVSAALFTLVHLETGVGALGTAVIVVGIAPLGLVFSLLLERRGSLLACIACHAVYNAGGVALLLLAAGAVEPL